MHINPNNHLLNTFSIKHPLFSSSNFFIFFYYDDFIGHKKQNLLLKICMTNNLHNSFSLFFLILALFLFNPLI